MYTLLDDRSAARRILLHENDALHHQNAEFKGFEFHKVECSETPLAL
jgi:hypothetical protein